MRVVLKRIFAVCIAAWIASAVFSQDTYPYFCGFETEAEVAGWQMETEGFPAIWTCGDAVSEKENKSLYVSADKGVTACYAEDGNGYYIAAYRRFTVVPWQSYDLVFDCKVGGEKASDGTVSDGMMVAWIPVRQVDYPASGRGIQFPQYARRNMIASDDGKREYANNGWRSVSCTVAGTFDTEYFLAFIWKTDGKDVKDGVAAAIDNVQFAPQNGRGHCAAKPWNVTSQAGENHENFTVTWEGNADKYEVQYYRTGSKENLHVYSVGSLTEKRHTVSLAEVGEGVYSVKVRGICGTDTSVWSKMSPDAFIYDASAHCLDFINLTSPDVLCTSGIFQNPECNPGVVDYGYASANSIHTVHYVQDEYDPRTNYMLKTVPDGAVASVRISNWKEQPAGSASITFKYHVTDESDVLKVRYAAVLQYADWHESERQTRIVVEIFDAETDTLLSQCTRSEFNARDVNVDDVRQWHEFRVEDQPAGLLKNPLPIKWCDWSIIGINLNEYIGRDLKIKYTLKACIADFHFAYAYFVLDCDKGEVDGITCGEHPETFSVPEGFMYRWYEEKNPEKTLGETNRLAIQHDDTARYAVDLIFPENEQCYFTLHASALPRRPISEMTYSIDIEDCINRVHFSNCSMVHGFWQGDTIDTDEIAKVCEWDFGRYGKSNDFDPVVDIPAEGDTFVVKLKSSIDKTWGCVDEKEFTVFVPSVLVPESSVEYLICEGATLVHDTVTFTAPGDYRIEYKNVYGCDSVVNVHIDMIVTETVLRVDTICSGDVYDFNGQMIAVGGRYADTIRTAIGCDSIIRVLDLTVNESLDVTFDEKLIACADCGITRLVYRHSAGMLSHISLAFDSAATAAGFVDIDSIPATDSQEVEIVVPSGVLPNRYDVTVTFFNHECGTLSLPLMLDVRYPSSVMVQRWNDVIALLNREYNGGYDFIAYQWFKNDIFIPGEIGSILYLPSGLDFSGEYSMLLTRLSDGVSQYTCALQPTEFSDVEDKPTVTFSDRDITVSSEVQGVAVLYDMRGVPVLRRTLSAGDNHISLPQLPAGVYILSAAYADGRTLQTKIALTR